MDNKPAPCLAGLFDNIFERDSSTTIRRPYSTTVIIPYLDDCLFEAHPINHAWMLSLGFKLYLIRYCDPKVMLNDRKGVFNKLFSDTLSIDPVDYHDTLDINEYELRYSEIQMFINNEIQENNLIIADDSSYLEREEFYNAKINDLIESLEFGFEQFEENIPAGELLVSLFESNGDIEIKQFLYNDFSHKLWFTLI